MATTCRPVGTESQGASQRLVAYHNRAIATQEVIDELIKLAKEMDAATKRGVDLGLPPQAKQLSLSESHCTAYRTALRFPK